MPTQAEWLSINSLSGFELKAKIFDIIRETAANIQTRERDDPDILSVVPRLAELISTRDELHSFEEILSSLARSVGLWNYIDKPSADLRDQIIAEAVTVPELGGITLHREQVAALNELLSGRNLILSAPTSFGKSLLVDALLASGRYRRVAIVLPTIALLDEFRRRLTRRFGETFQIVMYHSDESVVGNRVIFLGTQERLINRRDLGRLDLSVVDEFYKLDPTRRDDRSVILNAAVYELLRRSSQFFFLGPNIEGIRFEPGRWQFSFLKTRFSTVAVDTFDLRGVEDREARLFSEVRRPNNWPALVFVSSPDRANNLALRLSDGPALGQGEEFALWIEENFGLGWEIAATVRKGIGLHHGRIPRAVAARLIRLFDSGEIPVLLCTSTLIEGVNTAAKSVLIYDKAIARDDFDFFTFSNIRGRAGRLGQHRVGSVYLFHAPPEHETFEVQAPLFDDLDTLSNELAVHISDEERTPAIFTRMEDLAKALGLAPEELKLASSIGLERAAELKEHVRIASSEGAAIHWSGYPQYNDLVAVCEVIWKVTRRNELGAVSPKQLAFYINNLRREAFMRDFFIWHSKNQFEGASRDEIFRFLRACEYGLTQLLSVMELFAKQIKSHTDYSQLLGELPRWFRSDAVKNLEEQGVPVQISERFWKDGYTMKQVSLEILDAARSGSDLLTPFERIWVIDALGRY